MTYIQKSYSEAVWSENLFRLLKIMSLKISLGPPFDSILTVVFWKQKGEQLRINY